MSGELGGATLEDLDPCTNTVTLNHTRNSRKIKCFPRIVHPAAQFLEGGSQEQPGELLESATEIAVTRLALILRHKSYRQAPLTSQAPNLASCGTFARIPMRQLPCML
jgi:hypothetical protein